MNHASHRKLARSVVLVVALGQLVLTHMGVFAGAFAAAFLVHGHAHSLSVLPDAGHLDVVLHHAEEHEGHASGGVPLGFDSHDGDHVAHAASTHSARDGSRRLAQAPVTLVHAFASLAPRAAPLCTTPRGAPAAPDSSTLLRTVVLRV